MKISFAKPGLPTSGALVVGVYADRVLTPSAQQIDQASNGTLTRAMEAARFDGKVEQVLSLICPSGVELTRVVAIGLGAANELTAARWQSIGGAACAALLSGTEKAAAIALDANEENTLDAADVAANVAFGARLRSYRFDKYRTTESKADKPSLSKLEISSAAGSDAKKTFAALDAVADGVLLTRDLLSEPANILGPSELAKECAKLEKLGVKVTVLGEKELRKLGMGALLGVGQGSARESHVVAMEWQGAPDKDAAPLAIVGKGVCFDSGGISIKPAGGMEDMKWDMGGAGVTIGAMKALAGRKAKANVVGLVGLVENMPSGTAQRPGDVVTSMSGQTIEVINTDAEGRLVLSDVLTYCQQEYKPRAIIDLATLTGAIIISLGSEHAGLFSNDDQLAADLTKAGLDTGEKLWRMPLGEAYDKQIKSDIADMKNVGGREAGSITAAQFLQRFINKGTPWAHLDIAGVTWSKKDSSLVPKGGTAFGVRLLDSLVAASFESQD
jgi:leucyl aminopeptidase